MAVKQASMVRLEFLAGTMMLRPLGCGVTELSAIDVPFGSVARESKLPGIAVEDHDTVLLSSASAEPSSAARSSNAG
jgi:hypothetical protein